MKSNVITGIGVSGAGYPTVFALDSVLRQDKSCITRHQHFPECHFSAAQVGAILPHMEIEADLSDLGLATSWLDKAKKQSRRQSIVYQSALSAMLQASYQAGLLNGAFKPHEMALIVAGQNLHLNEQFHAYEKFKNEPEYLSPGYAQQFIDTTLMSFLSAFFNIKGAGFHVAAATASGNMGIIEALKTLDDRIKCCIVVAPMAALSPVELQAFYNVGALGGDDYLDAPDKASRPFDAAHNGFIYAQSAGCLVIERKDSAKRRQQPILSQIIATALCLDASASTAPSREGEINVMQQILALVPEVCIDMINTHGTGTSLGDKIEAEALEAVFGNKPFVNATKALIGHTLWSAGIIECIVCILQMQGGFLHGNINLENPINTVLNFVGQKGIKQKVETALSLGFGFGGINSAILLQQG